MDDRGDRVEKGERIGPGLGGDRLRQPGCGERAGGDDRETLGGEEINALTHDLDVGVGGDARGDLGGEALAINRQRRPGGDAVLVGAGHDQRAQAAHFLVEQPDGIIVGVIRAEAVRAHHFRKVVGFVRRSGVAAPTHLAEADP